jgi:hypothetical protein
MIATISHQVSTPKPAFVLYVGSDTYSAATLENVIEATQMHPFRPDALWAFSVASDLKELGLTNPDMTIVLRAVIESHERLFGIEEVAELSLEQVELIVRLASDLADGHGPNAETTGLMDSLFESILEGLKAELREAGGEQ